MPLTLPLMHVSTPINEFLNLRSPQVRDVDRVWADILFGEDAAELTPKYPYFISERVYALHAAARWWYEYREEALSIK